MVETLAAVSTWLPYVAFFLPLVVGLVTKSSLSKSGKAVVMLVLTGVAALLNQVDANAGILTVEMLNTWLGTMVITIASYYGVWSNIPVGNTNAGEIAPDFGVGPVPPDHPEPEDEAVA